jgi:hypothetical protein
MAPFTMGHGTHLLKTSTCSQDTLYIYLKNTLKDLFSGYANYGDTVTNDYWGTRVIQPGQIRSSAPGWDNYIFEK